MQVIEIHGYDHTGDPWLSYGECRELVRRIRELLADSGFRDATSIAYGHQTVVGLNGERARFLRIVSEFSSTADVLAQALKPLNLEIQVLKLHSCLFEKRPEKKSEGLQDSFA